MKLTPVAERFILHWGEMGAKWGVNRTVSQIHALLYLAGQPLHADEISETLGVARSNVSTSLRELQNWKLIRAVHLMNDRRDHFETSTDVWDLFRAVVQERKQREFDPTIELLRECVASTDFTREQAGAQQRIRETLHFMETLADWAGQMLRLPPATLARVMKLGAKVQQMVRPSASKKKPPAG